MSQTFRRRPGRFLRSSAVGFALLVAGCNYGFQGGGGFPPEIRSLFVAAFENETSQFDLDQQVFRKVQERVPRALGVRPAGRAVADATLIGRIVRYEDVAHNYRPTGAGGARAADVRAHQVQIVVSAQIVDTRRNVILWESTSITGQGEWLLDSESVDRGRERAIEQIVQKIIDGAQSQW